MQQSHYMSTIRDIKKISRSRGCAEGGLPFLLALIRGLNQSSCVHPPRNTSLKLQQAMKLQFDRPSHSVLLSVHPRGFQQN